MLTIWVLAMKPKEIKKIQGRSRDLQVMPINLRTFVVESRTDDLNNHIVRVEFLPNGGVRTDCTCTWAKYNGLACAHVIAALEHLAERKGRKLSFWLTEDDALRQKRRVFHMTHPDNATDGVWITSRAA